MTENTRVTIVGCGYVGMPLAVLLAQRNDVLVLDIDGDRVERVNRCRSTVPDPDIERLLRAGGLSLHATTYKGTAYTNADFVVSATPTNYDPETNEFDTRSVDSVVDDAMALTDQALVVIKSAVPVGHTRLLQEKHDTDRVVFLLSFFERGKRFTITCARLELSSGFRRTRGQDLLSC